MRTKITYILISLQIFVFPAICNSPTRVDMFFLIVTQTLTNKKIMVNSIYTKQNIIDIFGQPDKYNEWESDGGNGFSCTYGLNYFSFDPERGFTTFVLENNDFIIDGLMYMIGTPFDEFITTRGGTMEEHPAYDPDLRYLMFWPLGFVDDHLDIYFKKTDGEYKIWRVAFSSSM